MITDWLFILLNRGVSDIVGGQPLEESNIKKAIRIFSLAA
jgi:hypothetical protein